MNQLRRYSVSLATIAVLLPAVASAHPGHDDGHELTWDMSHLVAHPIATLSCLIVIGATVALLWRALSRPALKVRSVSARHPRA